MEGASRTWGIRFHASVLGLLLVVGFAGRARAELENEVVSAEKEMRLLEDKASLIEQEYINFDEKSSVEGNFESRLTDGQSLMILKDYLRAAIIFNDLVENQRNRNQPGYPEALFNLAESLFYNRNYIEARQYYRMVTEHPNGRPFLNLSLVRLMQIALYTNDFQKVDEIHGRLMKEFSTTTPESEYLWGKTLFLRKRDAEAATAFASLRTGQPFFFESRYYLGVVLVRQGKLEEALSLYTALIAEKPGTPQEKDIKELAHLARGRLLHDLDREVEAIDAFQAIDHNSPHFDDALFEICWTYLQRAERSDKPEEQSKWYEKAFRTLEILEVSTPDSTLVPKAALLRGHILEKAGKFEEASKSYTEIGQTYSTVKQDLDQLVVQHADPVRYFNELAGKNLDSFDLSTYLPPIAVKWMTNQADVKVALGVMKDIEAGQKYVVDARALLAKLDELLKNATDRISLFPALREGAVRTLEAENARVLLERGLAFLEERIINEKLSEAERQKFAQTRKERENLEQAIKSLSTTPMVSQSRDERIRQRIGVLEQSVYDSGIGLKGMKAQLTAMEEWIREHESELVGREEAVRDFRDELHRGWAIANQLQAELDSLSNQLAAEKTRAGLDSEALTREGQIRREYAEALVKERNLAEQIRSRLGPQGAALVARIDDLRLRTDRLHKKLQDLQRKLEDRVAERSETLKKQALQEEINLQQFEKSLSRLEGESKNLAGEVAFRVLQDVRQKFYQLVLEADVGLLDVAWSRKREKNQKIEELSKQQSAENRRLHEEYNSVLQEVQ
jgi:tetratricopeptide (TPR) repeat protein